MMQVRSVSSQEWPTLSGRFADLGYEQSLTYATAAAQRIGAELQFYALEQDGALVAATIVRIKRIPGLGRGIAWVAAGPLCVLHGAEPPDATMLADILRALRDEVAGRQGHILRFRLPALAFHEEQEETVLSPALQAVAARPTDRAVSYQSVAMDLTQDDEALMKQFQGKWRTDLRYALKSDLELVQGQSADLQARFLTLFEEAQASKGFRPDIAPEFHFALQGPDYRWEILLAHKEGQDIAGIVIGWSGETAVYLFGATADAGRRLRAGYFLAWSAMGLSRQRGMRWYDMGGLDAEENPSVARFKTRMNGRSIVGPGPYECRPSGLTGGVIHGLETLHRRLKGKA